ncbi:hypothetical protein BN8_00631 [Fibrisoma limi BUZ 3]|uniref:NHL repeat containing protein n=1 Tax=Fibrisoma limi BUZ 3 TaxID=1185876 RepID=I2GCR5_9BACT|nr:hypothetical protein [Fibrisoma limi]CCH51689.1 hypothetical protein BN8_00631 [Fibrisoma limi BUZ 3]
MIERSTNNIYVCDAKTNAIRIVSPNGASRVLAQNGDTNGTEGRLDEPDEPLLRNDRLYIASYNVTMMGRSMSNLMLRIPCRFWNRSSGHQRKSRPGERLLR